LVRIAVEYRDSLHAGPILKKAIDLNYKALDLTATTLDPCAAGHVE
jgi:hypothetical protein